MKRFDPQSIPLRQYLLALAALTCAVYANCLRNGVTLDDEWVWADNYFVKDLRNLPGVFQGEHPQHDVERSYQPLVIVTYFFDQVFWRGNIGGARLTNLALMVGAVSVVFQFGRRLTTHPLPAFFGAALFAVHPLHTEVVNHVCYRQDLLLGILLPAAWLLYKPAEVRRSWLWAPLGWVCYGLALLAGETALVFPALFVLTEWMLADGHWGRLLGRRRMVFLAGLLTVTLAFVVLRFYALSLPSESVPAGRELSMGGTLIAEVKTQALYVWLFLFPFPLSVHYPPSLYSGVANPQFFLSAAALLLLLGFVLYFRRVRMFVLGIAWWFVSLAPVSHLVAPAASVGERHLFLPSLGLCLWVGWLVHRAVAGRARGWALAAYALGLAMLGHQTVARNADWRDHLTLWSTAAARFPEAPTVLAHLAFAYHKVGNHDQAVVYGERALAGDVGAGGRRLHQALVHYCLGSALHFLGQSERALEHVERAAAMIPARPDLDAAIYRMLGLIYDDRGDLRTAVHHYQRAAMADPLRPDLWRKIAYCQLRLGNHKQARQDWDRARKLEPALLPFEEIEELFLRAKTPPAADKP